ncbi:hypothetical protein ACFCYN_14160 [Gottfriedia sp. NPDC056225]|uniref:hypothetical protein n=1 Tax=Gottfriedia sp. NPDC056225 TaxID=3345751 RepID=UPI0035DDD034
MYNFGLITTLIDLAIFILIGFVLFKIVKKIILFIRNNSSSSKGKMNELEQRISNLEKK